MSIADEKDDESFASRWSRRKRGEVAPVEEASEVEPIPLNTIINDGSTGKMQTMTEAERRALEQSANDSESLPALTDEDMPDVDELDESSDFSGFLSPGVSEKLRKVALRKLFAGAGFNIRDGLDDYDDDFTNFEPLGDIITSDMKHRAEMEAAKKEKEEQERLAAEAEQLEEEEVPEQEQLDQDSEETAEAEFDEENEENVDENETTT